MTAATQSAVLVNEIAAHLPLLERRVRMRELADVVEDAIRYGATSPAGFLRLAADYSAQSIVRRTRLDALRTAYAEAQSPPQRLAVLRAELCKEQAPRRTLAALARGWLDLDAMAERAELDLHELDVRQALSLRAAAALASEATARSMIEHLLDLLLAKQTPLCAVACAEAILDLLPRLRKPVKENGRWDALCALLIEKESARPRRVLAAIARLGLRAVPATFLKYASQLLFRTDSGDEFLLRQHVVVLLGQRGMDADSFALLVQKAQRGDPSEHVRVSLPNALRATGGKDAKIWLEAMAGAASSSALKSDESPRVRAAAAIALAELLRARIEDTSAALARIVSDPDPLVYSLVCEEIEALATEGRLDNAEAAILRAALSQRAMQAPNTLLAEQALHALEALAIVSNCELQVAHSLLSERLAMLSQGEAIELPAHFEPLTFGRLLARLARSGFGFYAQPVSGGYRVERGARFVLRAWRVLHELRWRTPYKRQDAVHTIGRKLYGMLHAPSGLLAEATSTAVPGEPLALASDGGWGPHVPTVDDLISMPLAKAEPLLLFSSRGLTRVNPPRTLFARLMARLKLSGRYAAYADLRLRSLEPADPSERTRYLDSLESLGFSATLEPYPAAFGETTALVPAVASPFGRQRARTAIGPSAMVPQALAVFLDPEGIRKFLHDLLSPADNSLGQLGVATLLVAVVMLASNIRQRSQIRRDRASIPLVIGGWGTRGKSGTERLKAAMLHALDINVVVKTTGCEAMFIHGVPGRKPTEVFIHRCYDKATIWEQRDLLSLAARLGARVFLWECMALAAPMVRVLSGEWMQDDLQTLTNAYPDHEDIQGPAGHDVARSIAGFIRKGGVSITTEEQMLPILAEEAKRKRARLLVVGGREHLLLAEDLLARFPYREHPRNIALVRRLAAELGLDPDLATADMADHVVPDLGVLKAYPTVTHRGRRMIFVNGMSANERTGFLSNWQRTGCERPVDQPGRWVVTVTNNRYDRVARSKAFAEILARDASAERHVLIGTNLSGLRVYLEESLTRLLQELRLFRDEDPVDKLPELLRARIQRIRHRLRIGPAEPDTVLTELSGWLDGRDVSALKPEVTAALAAAADWAQHAESLVVLEEKIGGMPLAQKVATLWPEQGKDLAFFLCRSIARRAFCHSLERAAEDAIANASARPALGARQDRLYRELFMDLVVAVEDSGASGDQVIDTIARSCPPGILATVMGIQNIKGTGLDFVYRFIRYDEVNTLAERLAKADGSEARDIAAALTARSDFGMLDSALAAESVSTAAERLSKDAALAEYLRNTASHLKEIAERCAAALRAGQTQRRNPVTRIVEKAFDTVDAVRRRLRADAILSALVHREISHERAALEMRRLVEREKKGWLRK